MIVAYCLGGGLGHITRVRAAAHTLGYAADELVIATVSPWAGDVRVTGPAHVVTLADPRSDPDPVALRGRLAALCADAEVTDLLIDAFPCGLVGELGGFDAPGHVRVTYLARLLRWDRYGRVAHVGRPPRIDRTLDVEQLTDAHARWCRVHGGAAGDIALVDPPAVPPPTVDDVDGDTCLVVHSGPTSETEVLVRMAREAGARRIAVVGPGGLDEYPAWPLFPRAARIVTAAGFNSVRQATPWRHKHLAVAFERRFDDQNLRAERAGGGWSGHT